MQKTAWIAFFSPAGTTKKSAEMISEEMAGVGFAVRLKDLSASDGKEVREGLSSGDVLFVGSPVYANHALPGVMDFIAGLPEDSGALAAPFVTYGAVTSGVALHEMAEALAERGFPLAGGIKIVAEHSFSRFFKKPIAPGRPNEYDAKVIRSFARSVAKKAEKAGQEKPALLSPLDLDYQGEKAKTAASKNSLEVLKSILPPMALNEGACIQCGNCEDACPTGNISLEDYPVLGGRCILCFNCVAACESSALTNPALSVLEPEIRKRKTAFAEPEETRAFL
ncbi:MAG: EFR1 family ferrodoxin [Proteobacteria bacterium]|nr:EFR1 family ferrodoxin [Pseudomonadota bacterium]